ncbi:Hydroxymethylglutaryl-coa synthase, partial [Globisporangium splendens]
MDPFADDSPRPRNVGILAMEVYFPQFYVAQADLERYNSVPAGKYTIGLGQDAMAFVGDREDVNSIALTCVARLLEKYGIDPKDVGRLEVGTETLVDKSKSTKTVLMTLFEECGNRNIEGASTINACYGATAAVLNAIAWVESSAWDGRYAIVVASDIAVYAKGTARPTGGCGGIAMLIGPDAPLAIGSKTRVTSACHAWDFYKPDPTSEYPTVDGQFSLTCYLQSLDDCYLRFCEKNEKVAKQSTPPCDVNAFDYAVFHSPYNKQVVRSFSRFLFLDSRRQPADEALTHPSLEKWRSVPLESTLTDRELDLAARGLAKDMYAAKVAPSCTTSKQVGNCYTGAVYINLATLVNAVSTQLVDKKILLFSYGSGSIASMFSIRGRVPTSSKFSIERMAEVLDIPERLAARKQISAEEYSAYMDIRQRVYGLRNITPTQSIATLAPGTFYLKSIDARFHRTYARTEKAVEATTSVAVPAGGSTNSNTEKWDRAGAVYVTGVSAGVPGNAVPFDGQNTLDSLLAGANCIAPLSDATKDAILSRRIVEVKKSSANGDVTRHHVATRDEGVQVAAVMQPVDLETQYGIAPALVGSMDEATRLGVAAGLDALKNANLVDGVSGKWRLPEKLQASTGIIYATSFPTMNAAVSEANRFQHSEGEEPAELDRKILFRLLVLANAQLAQITGARGPNTQVNAACAGTTQAIGMAHDWLALGKCDRVVVIASDVTSNETLIPWIGGGFRVLGAASTAANVGDAALPFDKRRNGMVLGAGAVGLVLESAAAFAAHHRPMSSPLRSTHVRLLRSHFSNSAYHGASLDPKRVSEELVHLLLRVEKDFGITRTEIAEHGVYYSHETFTNASPKTSCAYTEIEALRSAFGAELLEKLVIANTKGFTGHPMSVSFEDVVAVEGLRQSKLPPVVNFQHHDPNLGSQPLRLAKGGAHRHKYALHFAAGFGSQLAFTLYALQEQRHPLR